MTDCTDAGTGVYSTGPGLSAEALFSNHSFQFCKKANQHVLLNRGHDFIDAVVEGEGLTG